MTTMKLRNKIVFVTICFILLFAVLVNICTGIVLRNTMKKRVGRTLNGVCNEVMNVLTTHYCTDLHAVDGVLYACDQDISGETEFMDSLSENLGIDISIYCGNVRYLTTIRNKNNERITKTVMDVPELLNDVFSGKNFLRNNFPVEGIPYYALYRPIENSAGEICGILFAGIPHGQIVHESVEITIFVMFLCIVICVVIFFVVSRYTKVMCRDLNRVRDNLERLYFGNTSMHWGKKLLTRNDEISQIAYFVNEISKKMNELVERDPLTNLLNRHSGIKFLEELSKDLVENPQKISLALGKIDFFKNINDTFGNNYGDQVLVKISALLAEFCSAEDVVIRWSNEEFLIVFHGDKFKVLKILEDVKAKLAKTFFYTDTDSFSVTMTFGVSSFEAGDNYQKCYKRTESNLSLGKKSGRNRIIID